MARATFNLKSISRKIASSKKLNKKMERVAEERTRVAKEKMVGRIMNHPVSKEIAGGSGASNSSGTLMGGYGNLYTFIGFPAGRRPIQDIISLIQRKTYLIRGSSKKGRSRRPNIVVRNYTINYIDEREIHNYDEAGMPWESGSWIRGIEEGISSFSSYMYKAWERGRSRRGVQAKEGGKDNASDQSIRTGAFMPVRRYITKIIEDFRRDVRTMFKKSIK